MDDFKRLLDPLSRRVRALLMRGTVRRVDDSRDLQEIQVSRLEGEVLDGCERIGQYGIASNPPTGSEVVIAQISGNADHHVVLGVEDKSRPHPIPPGSVVIYDASGTTITLNADGSLSIAASGPIQIAATEVTITNDLVVNGNVSVVGLLNGHTP